MPSISFRFRARTQSQILDLNDPTRLTAGGIKARDARELIAAIVGTPQDEIEVYFGSERINDEEVVPFFSCVEVERCAPSAVRRGGGPGGAMAGRGGGLGGAPGAARQPEYIISASGEAYRVGRGGVLISANRGYLGRGGIQGNSETAGMQEDPSAATNEGELEFKRLQQRMADGVESVAVDTTMRGRGRGRGGMGMGAGGGPPGLGLDGQPKGPPPPGYVCHNCGNKGHHIEDCPKPRTNTGIKRVAPPDGIAESMLIPCSEDDPARCVTRDGRFVKRVVASDLFVAVAVPESDLLAEVTSPTTAAGGGGPAGSSNESLIADVLAEAFKNVPSPTPKTFEEANVLCAHCKKLLNKAVELKTCDCKVRFCSAAAGGVGGGGGGGGGDGLNSCVDKFIEAHDDEALCPKCEEPFYLDDLDEIPEVRERIETIKQLLKKRPRE